jgi:hypothetical protein
MAGHYFTFEPVRLSVSHWRTGGQMLKRCSIVVLALAVLSQGIVHADEPARADDVITVPDRAALLEHLAAMTVGETVAVATDDGVIAGELVDRDADDVVIDRPLIEGGAERVAIPLKEIQGLGYRQPPGHQPMTHKAMVIVAVVAGILLTTAIIMGRALKGP